MNIQMPTSRYFTTQAAIKLIAAQAVFMLATSHLHAQQVYKSVDINGRITYSEVPPTPGSGDKLTGESATAAPLPYALQQIVSRYPVTLYTAAECAPCINARLMLTQRGVPFNERTISSNEDIESYKKLNGNTSLPLATIASQHLKGYEETEWTKYLDAAGYPKSSILPKNYRHSEPMPLTQKKADEKIDKEITENPAAARSARPARTAPNTPQTPNSNPAGIKF